MNIEDASFKAFIDEYIRKHPEMKFVTVTLSDGSNHQYCEYIKVLDTEKEITTQIEFFDILKTALEIRLSVKSDESTSVKKDIGDLHKVLNAVRPAKMAEQNLG